MNLNSRTILISLGILIMAITVGVVKIQRGKTGDSTNAVNNNQVIAKVNTSEPGATGAKASGPASADQDDDESEDSKKKPGVVIMDNAPQDLGIYDSDYANLKEGDCRSCHGNSMADRHHETQRAIERQCQDCHEVVNPAGLEKMTKAGKFITKTALRTGSEDDFGVTVQHNCVECHEKSWHHKTDYARNGKCSACHSEELVTDVGAEEKNTSAITSITPSVESCSNCHAGTDEAPKGLAYNIKTPEDNHHDTGLETCTFCHQTEDEFDIRGCQNCHGKNILHNIEPHVKDNDMCFGCHGNNIKQVAKLPGKAPSIASIDKNKYLVDEIMTIKGSNFGDYLSQMASHVSFSHKDGVKKLPVVYWSNDTIEVRLAYEFFEKPGSINIAVNTPGGKSGSTSVNVAHRPLMKAIAPAVIGPGGEISIQGANFGAAGRDNKVVVTSPNKKFDADIKSWSNNAVTALMPKEALPGEYMVSVYASSGKSANDVAIILLDDAKPTLKAAFPDTVSQGSLLRLVGFGFGSKKLGGEVLINNTKAEVISWTNTRIQVRVPANAAKGKAKVEMAIGTVKSNPQEITIR